MMACKELWSNNDPKFDGKYLKFSDVVFTPKPVQKSIPIWIGGGKADRRCGERRSMAMHGIRWAPIGSSLWIHWAGSRPALPSYAI